MGYEIKHYTSDSLTTACAERLVELCLSVHEVFLLVSAGSSFTVLQKFVKILEEKKSDLKKTTIAFVDERFDKEHSNFITLSRDYQEILSITRELGAQWIDTSPAKKDQYEMAEWYDKEIRNKQTEIRKKEGKIICLLGMGKDGHIAGILPYPIEEEKEFYEKFLDTDRLVVGYAATGKNQFAQRFTLTYPGLLQFDHILAYIAGEEKKKALYSALKENPAIYESPALFFQQTSQPCEIFTDITL